MRNGSCIKVGVSAALALACAAFAQPANDNCANATAVGVGAFPWDNTGATIDGSASCGFGGQTGTADIWYSFTPTTTDNYFIDTCTAGTIGDTIVSVYDTCGGTELVCNDDFCGLLSRATLAATANTTYLIRIAEWSNTPVNGTGTLTITQAPPAPNNDSCANAIPITIGSAVTVDNTGATEDGAASCGFGGSAGFHDVWYSFTAPNAGCFNFSTCGGQLDTIVSVFDACGGAEIGCDDDFCGIAAGSQARAVLTSGQQVRIRVAGWGVADEGQTSLEVTQGVVPANDLCANAIPLTLGTAVAFDNSCSGTEGASSCGFGGDPGANDIWYSFNAPATGLFRVDTCQSGGLDTQLGVYDSCGGSEIACNDDACGLSSAVTINAVQGTNYIIRLAGWNGTQGAGQINVSVPAANDLCSGAIPVVIGSTNFDTSTAANDAATNCGGSGPELFYSFTPAASGGYQIDTVGSSYDTVLGVFEADCVTEVACNDDNGTLQSTVSVFLTGGTTYIIQADGFGGGFGAGVLNINGPIAGPANDLCANATAATLGSNPFDNRFAGNEGAASCGFNGDPGSADVWFSFTAPATQAYRFDTCQSAGLDTIVSLYDSCGGSEIACNDDSCGLSSAVTFNTTQGTTYYVRVAGWAGAQGAGALNISAPLANDVCATASPATLGTNPFDTSAAANDAATNCGGSGPDIFFTFTPADTGGYQFSTCNGTGYDSILAVLNNGCAGELACNDDACGLQSTVVANLTAGTTYIVQVDGFGGGSGAGNLEITFLGGGGGNNYTVCDSSNAFEDISSTGTLAGTISGCDDCTESLPIGFSFDFYGTAFTDVQASSNGLVAFGTPSAVFGNVAIPNAATPNSFAAAIWDDMNPGAQGDIYYQTSGTAGSRTFTVSWQGVTQFALTTNENFQVVLHEGTNNIEFRYGAITAETPAGDYSVGCEDANGLNGTAINGADLGTGNIAKFLIPAGGTCPQDCDTIDWNGDGLFPDVQDIADYIFVFGGGACPTGTCNDLDYNNDTLLPDTTDIQALISVFGGGPCIR